MTKIKIEIKNRFTGNVLFQYEKENNTIKDTVEAAIKSKADLSKADLSKADLSKADLSGANLSWANLSWADLSKADLSKANLSKADLSKANLSGANLSEADLYGANLYGADLSWADLSKANLSVANLSWADLSWADLSKANLSGANLSKADLSKANLSEADLSLIKNDMFAVLLNAIPEVPNFRKALVEGKIDGSTYTGECACLCGTLMKSGNKELVTRVDNVKDSGRPIERWFLGIWRGDTPESNPMAKLALGWTDEFLSLIGKII